MAGKAFNTTYSDCLAVVCTVPTWRLNIEGWKFTIRAGHEVLQCIVKITDETGKLVRWSLRLLQIGLEVVQWAVVKHQIENALSRTSTTGLDESPLENGVSVPMKTESQLEGRKTETDPGIWHSTPCNACTCPLKPALLEVLVVSDGTVNENSPTTRDLVTALTAYPY